MACHALYRVPCFSFRPDTYSVSDSKGSDRQKWSGTHTVTAIMPKPMNSSVSSQAVQRPTPTTKRSVRHSHSRA